MTATTMQDDGADGADDGAGDEPDLGTDLGPDVGPGGGEPDMLGPRPMRIVNLKGLHARASARFVETVQAHDAAVLVEKDGEEVSGTDLLGLLMLAGTRGTTIEVSASGPDAKAALDALEALVVGGFGEGE